MKKLRFIIFALIAIAAVCMLRKIYIDRPVNYPGVTPETFAYLLVPADENDGIYTDITGMVTGEKAVLFLPCRADISSLTFYCMDAQDEPLEKYVVDFTSQECEILGVPVICMKSQLPSVEITLDERLGTLEQVNEDELHNTTAYGDLILSCTDEVSAQNGWDTVFKSRDRSKFSPHSASIKGRGQQSWTQDKKPYLVKIEENVSLLGLQGGTDWVFLANVMDHALVRNEVALSLAKQIGCMYVSDLQPVDLFVDGEYLGNYSMCSQVEPSPERVPARAGRDYLYRLGIESGNYRNIESSSMSPDCKVVELMNGIAGQSDEEAFDIMQRAMLAIEDTSSSDYLNYIDIESWARYYWVQEITKNTDACFRSVYTLYNGDTGRVYMISPWDFDRTIGTVQPFENPVDYLLPDGWSIRCEDYYVPLFEHEEFAEEVRRVYFEGGVRETLMNLSEDAAGMFARIEPSAAMNFTRWDYLTRPLEDYENKIAYFMGDSSYESEKQWLILWLDKRAEWIDDEMTGAGHSE